MSGTPANILTQPGFLYWQPTNLTAAPFGGTSLGFTEEGIRIRPNIGAREVKGEETGDETLETIFLGADVKLFVTLKETSDIVLQRAFPGGLTDAGGSNRFIQFPGTLLPGSRFGDEAGRLLFHPLDSTNNKVALFHKAAPRFDQASELMMRLREDTNYTMIFDCLRNDAVPSAQPEYPYRIAFIGDVGDASIEPV